jgi:hypothetical protein
VSGHGEAETYISLAGFNALNLQNYFTAGTKSLPYQDTDHSATAEATHTFVPADHITVKRYIERVFIRVEWFSTARPIPPAWRKIRTQTIP